MFDFLEVFYGYFRVLQVEGFQGFDDDPGNLQTCVGFMSAGIANQGAQGRDVAFSACS